MKKGDCVGIEWDDAFAELEPWTENGDIDMKRSHRVYSVGLLFGETKGKVVIVGDAGPGSSGRILHIPRGMIRKVWRLRI